MHHKKCCRPAQHSSRRPALTAKGVDKGIRVLCVLDGHIALGCERESRRRWHKVGTSSQRQANAPLQQQQQHNPALAPHCCLHLALALPGSTRGAAARLVASSRACRREGAAAAAPAAAGGGWVRRRGEQWKGSSHRPGSGHPGIAGTLIVALERARVHSPACAVQYVVHCCREEGRDRRGAVACKVGQTKCHRARLGTRCRPARARACCSASPAQRRGWTRTGLPFRSVGRSGIGWMASRGLVE